MYSIIEDDWGCPNWKGKYLKEGDTGMGEVEKVVDDVLKYGWAEFTPNQKIAIGQMQEEIKSLEKKYDQLKLSYAEENGRVQELRILRDTLLNRLIAVAQQ